MGLKIVNLKNGTVKAQYWKSGKYFYKEKMRDKKKWEHKGLYCNQ